MAMAVRHRIARFIFISFLGCCGFTGFRFGDVTNVPVMAPN
jgi:hypothetical protein